MTFRHECPARRPRAAIGLGVTWLVLLAAWTVFDMAPWILAGLLAFTLPAAWDFATRRLAWLAVDETHMRWRSGRQAGEVALARIAKVRFERRLDMSPRVRLVLDDGRRLSLPQDTLPARDRFREVLVARGLRCEDHPFSLL